LQHGRDIAADIDLGDAIAADPLQRLGARLAGPQADLAKLALTARYFAR